MLNFNKLPSEASAAGIPTSYWVGRYSTIRIVDFKTAIMTYTYRWKKTDRKGGKIPSYKVRDLWYQKMLENACCLMFSYDTDSPLKVFTIYLWSQDIHTHRHTSMWSQNCCVPGWKSVKCTGLSFSSVFSSAKETKQQNFVHFKKLWSFYGSGCHK